MEETKFIQYKNIKVFCRIYGKGKAVVLLHGLPVDGDIWKEQAEILKDYFHLIIPDLPGSGRSEMLANGNTLPTGRQISIDDYAELIKAILDEEKISQCTMIGHSMGGYITLAFAEKYPELLNGIGLFHSSAFADDEEKKQTRRKTIEFVQKNGIEAFLQTMIPNLFAENKHQNKINELINDGKRLSAKSLIQYYYAMINRPDRTDILKTFSNPVLFIIGEKDTAIPLNISLQQCHLPKIAHVNILKDVGHMGMIEKSARSTDMLLSFLQKI